MAILDGILAAGSLTPRAQLSEPVRVRVPPPFGAKLLLVPLPGISGQLYMSFSIVALALREIPAGVLLVEHGWVESRILVSINDIPVANGAFVNL